MNISEIFINSVGRLRSGWRFCFFGFSYLLAVTIFGVIIGVTSALILGKENAEKFFDGRIGFFLNGIFILTIATLIGWLCGLLLEGLPFKAFGWSLHQNWLKHFFTGSLVGVLSLLLAVAVIFAFGGYRFSFNNSASTFSIAKSILISLFVFIVAAAAEEAAFRGYGLQTMARSHIGWAWVSILFLSLGFGLVHLGNPNVKFIYTFTNTALAGIWLSVAYLKTRSLWFPLGVHWAWNWVMAAIFGIPVSGITSMTPAPLLRVEINEPTWLSGGSYGVEGGIVCGIAVLISTIAIYLLPIAEPTEEMYALTSKENPASKPNVEMAFNGKLEKNP
jgi:membrane protease YdiL (CAAX protease family)